MKIFDFNEQLVSDAKALPADLGVSGRNIIVCSPSEVEEIGARFCFDKATLFDCETQLEGVRFHNFLGYDFLSVEHLTEENNALVIHEFNLYISRNYMVIVFSDAKSDAYTKLCATILAQIESSMKKGEHIIRAYSIFLHLLLTDYAQFLETVEDEMEAFAQTIDNGVQREAHEKLDTINNFRNVTYALKKQMRAHLNIGSEILFDENDLISDSDVKYFKNISLRLAKLYDFSSNLCVLAMELLHSYDSKLSAKTNDAVTRLAVLTSFFAPLSLITGVYGMNFINMHELEYKYAYPIALLGMCVIVLISYLFVKKNKLL